MNSRPTFTKMMFCAAATLTLATTSQAAINLVGIDEPINSAAAVFTTDSNDAGRGVAFDRNLRQSFKVAQDLTVTDIILGLDVNDDTAGIQMRIYEVDDVNAVPFAPAGDPILDIVLAAFDLVSPTLQLSSSSVHFQFTDADQFTLPARTGTAGYALEISTDDEEFISTLGTWRHSNTGTDLYADGEYYTESGGQGAAARDYLMSIDGIVSNVLLGDTDGDGDIDDFDLINAIVAYTGSLDPGTGGKTIADGDTDDDQDVDDFDLINMIVGYTGSLSSPSVPEPGSVALLSLGGLALVRRRR